VSGKVGIKTDNTNRIRVRGALIVEGVKGLVADLGKGFFVITKEASEELLNRGVEFTEVEIVKGLPKCELCGKSYARLLPTIPPTPNCDCEKPQSPLPKVNE